jgi:dTDP-4-amino-4,6-dideoxygalactose transaminase
MIPFVDLRRQYHSIKDEVDAALLGTAEAGDFILGQNVESFEQEFAAFCDTRCCVGVGSGTAALHLALEALGVSSGDEVVAPANTFIATVVPALKLGARPVLVDCDEETSTIDVEQAAAAVTPRTRAILAVHLYGQPADLDPLRELCQERGIALVEDACQAHGARYKGARVGGLGSVAAFSFYPAKNLGAFGDAGAVTTNDAELAERIRLLRDLGQARKYDHVLPGWNERLDTIQASVLRVKLRHLERWNELRRAHADAYERVLAGTGLGLPRVADWAEHVWHLYVVRARERDALREKLQAQGIATGLHYPVPLHLQPALKELGYRLGDFPVAEHLADEILSLPMFPELEPAEIDRIAEALGTHAAAA